MACAERLRPDAIAAAVIHDRRSVRERGLPTWANLGEQGGSTTVLLHVSADGGGGCLAFQRSGPECLAELMQERSCTGQSGKPAVLVFLQESVRLI